jgi:phenylacetate-CoA ligase
MAMETPLQETLRAALALPGWATHLAGAAPDSPLATLPVLRKADLPAMQALAPPFAGLAPLRGRARLFVSPGPIFEGVGDGPDPWRFAPALAAAGIAAGDVVLNTFGYHLTPGGFIFDSAARALGCAVIPAGPGNTAQILEAIRAYRPVAYNGTPDFLKILLEAADAAGVDAACMTRAVVTGAAFPPSLKDWVAGRGITAVEAYGTAELGLIAHSVPGEAGMRLAPGIIVEILRPGTGEPLPEGEIGEVVVTIPDPAHPVIRFSPGDMSAFLPGGTHIRGWLGRADQTAKVRGMFVRPEQVAAVARAIPGLGRLRLRITREGEQDAMELLAEGQGDAAALAEALRAATGLRGEARYVAPGSLPADGRVIDDRR